MKSLRIIIFALLVLALGALLVSCGSGSSTQGMDGNGMEETAGEMPGDTGGMSGMDHGAGEMAPPMLVEAGEYSDQRFIDMMSAHHQMAIDMAKVAQDKGEHPEVKKMAADIISAQQKEIDEMKAIKQKKFGSSTVPTQMDPVEMENTGMMMPDQLAGQKPFDKAFIDSMTPHHAAAITMASVAYMRSEDPEIKRISRAIIDEQSREIGQMIQWRKQWYPGG